VAARGDDVAETKRTVKGSAKATIDHEEIRAWAEQHGGRPAAVKSTRRGGTPGILRIDFPGFSGEQSLEEISWDEFFERFEQSQLAFLYQDQTGSGKPSRFNKLVSRDTAEVGTRKGAAKRSAGKRSAGGTARQTSRTPAASRPRKASSKRATKRPAAKKKSSRGRSASTRRSG
jgi:hypothetical protein